MSTRKKTTEPANSEAIQELRIAMPQATTSSLRVAIQSPFEILFVDGETTAGRLIYDGYEWVFEGNLSWSARAFLHHLTQQTENAAEED